MWQILGNFRRLSQILFPSYSLDCIFWSLMRGRRSMVSEEYGEREGQWKYVVGVTRNNTEVYTVEKVITCKCVRNEETPFL